MKVSVAICTYNGEKYISEQLQSILNQSRRVDEIIISDDNSLDDTVKIVEDILVKSGISYRLLINEQSLGVIKNFRQCYEACSGDVIFSCDQDDIWVSDKVEKIISEFNDPTVDMVATNAFLIDGNGQEMELSLRDVLGFDCLDRYHFIDNLLRNYCITGATMAIRREFALKYYQESSYWLHDGWLAMVAGLKESLVYLDDRLIKYRLHGGNVVGLGKIENKDNNRLIEKEKKKYLIKRTITQPFYHQDLFNAKYNAYSELLALFGSNDRLNDCVDFWKKRSEIKDYDFRKFLIYYQESGENFYLFDAEYLRKYDIYLWIIFHLFRRYNH